MPPIIRVENLGKCYRIHHESRERYTALRDVIARKAGGFLEKLKFGKQKAEIQNAEGHDPSLLSQFPISAFHGGSATEDFWALKDVSFEVNQGEVVGIIGRNGAGKSTLLKILSRITEPTKGRITLNGRVASLLEVGTGFHPELTGRENIYLNGAILGMTKAEIKSKFDEIVAFAEVERFLDTPVKRYSSGMYVRLAFAVAAHLEPEILVVDEVLAVGDAEFQKKCLGKMGEVARGGRTVLFVSHNMSAVMNLCDSGILLRNGCLTFSGGISQTVSEYLALAEKTSGFLTSGNIRSGDRKVFIQDMKFMPENPVTGDSVKVVFELMREDAFPEIMSVDVAIGFFTETGDKVLQVYSVDTHSSFGLREGRTILELKIDRLPLTPGDYRLNVWIGSGGIVHDWIQNGYLLTVGPGGFVEGRVVGNHGYSVVLPGEWNAQHPIV
ncbi:MAG: ABC transporter ATP-binding protein [Prosthecobacter sp.]|uniref:ABC transporter ATP-binding protein n=1 Tax=Prosthecobacter sp. TaxID=1965333 RepID=UPI0038FD4BD8